MTFDPSKLPDYGEQDPSMKFFFKEEFNSDINPYAEFEEDPIHPDDFNPTNLPFVYDPVLPDKFPVNLSLWDPSKNIVNNYDGLMKDDLILQEPALHDRGFIFPKDDLKNPEFYLNEFDSTKEEQRRLEAAAKIMDALIGKRFASAAEQAAKPQEDDPTTKS